MYYYNKETNHMQSTPFIGSLIFPDEFLPVYYNQDKRVSGFVKITDDGTFTKNKSARIQQLKTQEELDAIIIDYGSV